MSTTILPPQDAVTPAEVEAFAGRILGIISDASTGLSISIGHRTGLFDALAVLPPSTTPQVAEAAGLQERYVREWLAAMLVGGIVAYDPAAELWSLPPAHAAILTRRAGKDNLAKLAQLIGLLADVEHEIVRCFREGGGVPYHAYGEFHALMAEDSHDMAEGILLDEVVPLVAGLDGRLRDGIRVADIGCGGGHHLAVLARTHPASTFVGYDFEEPALALARDTAEAAGLTNLTFELRDVQNLSGTGPFELVTAFDAIHDQAHPASVLRGIAEALTPDGVFLMADISVSSDPHDNIGMPGASFVYGVSLLHCMPVSLAQGGDGLGAAWGEQTAVRMLHEAGFASVEVHRVDGDPINNYYVATRG